MLLHFIKLVPNDKNAHFPSSRGNPSQVMATLRNEAFDWHSTGSDLPMDLSTAQKHSFGDTAGYIPSTSGDRRTSDKSGKGTDIPVTPAMFILPHFFSSRTYMLWKLKFHLQVSQSASVPVKCIPYLITTAITLPATKNLNNQAESGPAQSHF